MKVLIKANTVDKYLLPIRLQLMESVEPNTTVIEYGCGNGDLLFKLAHKIQHGIGLDLSFQLIEYALKRKEKEAIHNLDFEVTDLTKSTFSPSKADYAIVSLLFHLLSKEEALVLLKKVIASSGTTLICGFHQPQNAWQNLLLWVDQRFTKHYSNFRGYQQKGYMEGLLNSIENLEYSTFDTFDPVIKVYKIT